MLPPDKNFQRLFLALWPDPATLEAMVKHTELWTWPQGCARYKPVDWHVTLHFLGDVPAPRLAELTAGLKLPFDSFELVLDQPQQWPRGLSVLGASRVPDELAELQQRLALSLAGLKLPVEHRPYRPHVTLARRADAAIPPSVSTPVVWPVRSYALVRSTGRPEQRYQVVCSYLGTGS